MVKLVLNFTSKGSYVPKIIDELILKLVPFGDVEKEASLVLGHGLKHDLGLGGVLAIGEGEEVDAGCMPGIKVIRLAALGSSFHLGRFQDDGLSMVELRRLAMRRRRRRW